MMIVFALLSACDRKIPILVNDWCADERSATILDVIDGDTVTVDSGETLRLLGIDSPEIFYEGSTECTSQDALVCCNGLDAEVWLAELLPEGTTVRLTFDLECEDTYGRTLAYLWLPTPGDTGDEELFINEHAITEGMARLFDEDIGKALDIRYYEQFQSAQTSAQSRAAGLWSACY